MNRLGNDNYKRPEFTEQDYISSNREVFKEKLKNYIQVESQFIETIPCKTWIKYITNDGLYRAGNFDKK